MKRILFFLTITLLLSCGKQNIAQETTDSDTITIVGPVFSADSAYAFVAKQCDFGPRVMNSPAHEQCKNWIVSKFRNYGLNVIEQTADLLAYDGTKLHSTNIIAQYNPNVADRILLCAHWDSRPWADNDPDEANHHTAIDGANDGASGVAVLLEIARLLSNEKYGQSSPNANDSLSLGIDFICFDAEDYGIPQWAESDDMGEDDSWALGAQYWANNPHTANYSARYGILLDMVGGYGARFHHEYFSKQAAPAIIAKLWRAAADLGYGSIFPNEEGGAINDDHCPIIKNRHIPMVDIIPHYPDCEQSSFGPTWHTINDNLQHISKETLKAVGQTLVQVIYSE